jgi:16S rRNA (guanine(966)-N(2))-methyltransferase RsmD
VGLEAASRGAAAVVLVEAGERAARTVRANIAGLGLAATCQLRRSRVLPLLSAGCDEAPYDVVFADPPYATEAGDVTAMLSALVAGRWLAPGAVVAVERSTRSPQPQWVPPITLERSRTYGESTLWYGRAS